MRTLFIAVAALAAIVTSSPIFAQTTTQKVEIEFEVPKGWTHSGKVHGTTAKQLQACKGKLVVDHESDQCTEIPARTPGGPKGKRCPNVCRD